MKRLMRMMLAVAATTMASVAACAAEMTFDFRPAQASAVGVRGAYNVLATKESADSGLLRTHLVRTDAPAMDVAVADGDMLTFQLFEDKTFRIHIVERMPSVTDDMESWIGVADGYGETFNSVVVRTKSGWQLDVQDFQNGLSYRVYTADGVATVSEFDLGAMTPRCGSSRERVSPVRHRRAAMLSAETPKHTPAADTAASTYVDILVCFDKSAQTWCSKNSTTPASFAATAVAKMNTALANTGLDTKFRYRLAGTYNINGTGGTDLEALIYAVWGEGEAFNLDTGTRDYMYNGTDWSIVETKRDEVGADLATVLVDIGDSGGGLLVTGIGDCPSAYEYLTGDWTYSCCAISFVSVDHTLTHEVGHNMGCDHPDSTLVNSDYITPGPGVYPYSCGYHFTAQGTKYYTIMAYNYDGYGNNYTLCPYFSSPNYSYKGVAVGNAIHDNTRTLENTYAKVAAFRNLVADKCTIKFDGNGGSSPAGFTRNKGEALGTLPSTTWAGHTFAGWWTARSGGTQVTASTKATGSATYYAHWNINQYKLTFNANGGTVSPAYAMVDYCKTCDTFPTPTWSGHTFNGWYTARSGGTKVTAPWKCTGGKTIYAQWTAKQYTITFNANGGTVSPASKKVDYCATYTLPTPTWSEHTFGGWYTEKTGGTKVTSPAKCTGNKTLYAHWTASGPVFVTSGDAEWTKQADGSWKSGKITHNQETWIETTVTGPGSVSFDWKVSSEGNDYDGLDYWLWGTVCVQTISGERDWQTYGSGDLGSGTITIRWRYYKDESDSEGDDCGWIRNFVWTPKQYKITYNANGGTVSPAYKMVGYCKAYGDLATPTYSGREFVGWFTAKTGGTQVTKDTKCTGNATIYAQWKMKQYKITCNANGGTVSPAYKMVDYCAKYGTLPTPTWSGHTFNGWFTARTGGTQVTEATKCVGGATIYAQWTVKQYKISFDANDPLGEVALSHKMVDYCGTYGDLPTPTKSGSTYLFAGWWTAPKGGTPVGYNTKCTGNKTIYAQWANASLDGYKSGGDGSWDKLSDYVWNSGTGLGDNQQRWLRASVRGSGTYSFDWSVTSQKDADFLSVYVDGVKVDAISGSTAWITKQLKLTGNYWHSIFWVYSKDASIGQSYDCGRLSNLEWNPD